MKSWSEAYMFGIPIIDQQHEKLFTIFDEIIKNKDSKKIEIESLLEDLEQYVTFHFKEEEKLLKLGEKLLLIKSKDVEEHIEEHNGMLLAVMEWRKMYIADDVDIIQTMLDYIRDWLIGHIMISDAKFVPQWKKFI